MTEPTSTPDGGLRESEWAAGLTYAVLAHYGYLPEEMKRAENVHPGKDCGEDCWDEDGRSIHGRVHTELHRTAALVIDVVLPYLAAHPDSAPTVEGEGVHARLVAEVRSGMAQRGWYQADLAFAAGLSEKHLSQMLTGRVDGSLSMWQHLLDTLTPVSADDTGAGGREHFCTACLMTDRQCEDTDGGCCEVCRATGGCSHTSEHDPATPSPDATTPPVTSVELVAAARWLLLLRDDPALSGTIYRGALGMWTEMTSAPSEAVAVEWAEAVAALDTLPAHVSPF